MVNRAHILPHLSSQLPTMRFLGGAQERACGAHRCKGRLGRFAFTNKGSGQHSGITSRCPASIKQKLHIEMGLQGCLTNQRSGNTIETGASGRMDSGAHPLEAGREREIWQRGVPAGRPQTQNSEERFCGMRSWSRAGGGSRAELWIFFVSPS